MRWTTFISALLLIPVIFILAFIRIASRSTYSIIDRNGRKIVSNDGQDGFENEELFYLSNKEAINELAQYIAPSLSKCNCDNSMESSSESLPRLSSTSKSFSLPATQTTTDIGNELPLSSTDQESRTSVPLDPITIFLITPTYTRGTQMADMTRLAQTLMLVKDVFWIVVEDSHAPNPQVTQLLNRTGIPHIHLLGPRPKTHLDKRSGRGVSNRLAALDWLRATYSNTSKQGVIYFADDDNAYDIRVFEEMRNTEKVSVWPVGCLAITGLSSPIIDIRNGSLVGFHDPWIHRRKFPVDMAGFAVNLQLFLSKPKAIMPYKVGYEEDYFIRSLGVKLEDLEPKANNCTEVYVWHTKTQTAPMPSTIYLKKEKDYNYTNLAQLYKGILLS